MPPKHFPGLRHCCSDGIARRHPARGCHMGGAPQEGPSLLFVSQWKDNVTGLCGQGGEGLRGGRGRYPAFLSNSTRPVLCSSTGAGAGGLPSSAFRLCWLGGERDSEEQLRINIKHFAWGLELQQLLLSSSLLLNSPAAGGCRTTYESTDEGTEACGRAGSRRPRPGWPLGYQ